MTETAREVDKEVETHAHMCFNHRLYTEMGRASNFKTRIPSFGQQGAPQMVAKVLKMTDGQHRNLIHSIHTFTNWLNFFHWACISLKKVCEKQIGNVATNLDRMSMALRHPQPTRREVWGRAKVALILSDGIGASVLPSKLSEATGAD